MSSQTPGPVQPPWATVMWRIMAVIGIDFVCFLLLVRAALSDGFSQMGAGPHKTSHELSWTLLLVGGALLIHAGYAYWRKWFLEVGLQTITAVVLIGIGFTLMG